MVEIIEHYHTWESGNLGVIVGVSKCIQCGQVSREKDFFPKPDPDEAAADAVIEALKEAV